MGEGSYEGPSRCDLVRRKVHPASAGLTLHLVALIFEKESQVVLAFSSDRWVWKIASVYSRSTRSGVLSHFKHDDLVSTRFFHPKRSEGNLSGASLHYMRFR